MSYITNYLTNDICKFKLYGKLSEKKQNILSCVFFKMNSHYKNFNIYINGITKLIKVLESQNNFILRLFIDDAIFEDPHIMKIIKSSNKVQYVVFSCSKYIKSGYHEDLFGTLIRFFPIFDFDNNDSSVVIICDIELNNEDLLILKNILNYTSNEQLFAKGAIYKYFESIKKGIPTIIPHVFATIVRVDAPKFDKNIILDFIKMAPQIEDVGLYEKRLTPFGYGIDEIFTTKHLTILFNEINYYLIYTTNWFLYYNIEKAKVKYPKKTFKILKYILLKYYKNQTTEELIKEIDKLFYRNEIINDKIRYVSERYYYVIKYCIKHNIKWFSMPIMKIINKWFNGIIFANVIIKINTKTNEIISVKELQMK